jgi:NitT/TauT family transport system permease protein
MTAAQRETASLDSTAGDGAALPPHSADVLSLPLHAAPAAFPGTGESPVRNDKPRRPPAQRNLLTLALGAVSLGLMLLFWYLATKYRLDFYVRFTNIPSPGDVVDATIKLGSTKRFYVNIGISVRRILIGFGVATVLGITLGMLIGRFRVLRDLFFPALEVLRPIPAIAWVPISIMLWPSNEVSIVFITFLGAFFPILLNTIHGVVSLDKVLVRAASSLGAGGFALFRDIILPGSLPHIFTGLTVGMGVAWVSLIAAEMISGQFGIGYFTWEAYSLIAYAEIVIGMIVIGILGLSCSAIIRATGRMLMPWAGLQNGENRG